ncbi:MAG: hypothetical protein K2N94_15340 [Lachnospiraceae bacterium]|nr:hypothetical protein [Lachnospiraceae bacterium]
MKKLYICILCLAVICLAACSEEKIEKSWENTENQQSLISENNVNTDDGIDDNAEKRNDLPHDVPYILAFDSFDKIAELREIVNKNNQEIESYLKSNGFNMNGLRSKEDVNNLFNQIGNLNILYLDDASGYNLAGILYYVSYGYIMFTYSNGNDIVRFICYIDDGEISTDNNNMNMNSCYIDDGEISTNNNNMNTNSATAEELMISGNVVSLYKVEDTDSPFKLSGRFETSNSNITILFSNQEETNVVVENIRENVVVSTLLDLIK